MPEGYAPFNVQNIGRNIYVAYTKQDGARHDEVDGAGRGFVDVFSSRGQLLHRLEHGSFLNAPWGLALASGDFGSHSHDVLVGQFGSGEILAFDAVSGAFKGRLIGPDNNPFHADGLWAIAFGGELSPSEEMVQAMAPQPLSSSPRESITRPTASSAKSPPSKIHRATTSDAPSPRDCSDTGTNAERAGAIAGLLHSLPHLSR